MSPEAIATMVIGVAVVWGALVASILHAVRTTRARKAEGAAAHRPDL